MCSPTWKLSVPCTVGVFMEVSSYRFDQLLIQSLPHFSPGSRGGRTERSKLLILAWFFLQQAPTQEPTRSCLLRPKKKKKITGNLRGLGVLLQETGQRANTYFVFCHPGSYRYFFSFPCTHPDFSLSHFTLEAPLIAVVGEGHPWDVRTAPYLDSGGGHTNIHKWWNCVEINKHIGGYVKQGKSQWDR